MATNEQVAREQWHRFRRAREGGHKQFLRRAKQHESYYLSEQWDAGDIQALKGEGRPALTLNMFTNSINTVLGEQIGRSAQVAFRPRRGGSQDTADTLAKVYMQVADENDLEDVESDVFADALIMDGRGYFDVRIDFDAHAYGEVRITSPDPMSIVIGPDARTDDPREWPEFFQEHWLSLEEIELAYGPRKMREVRGMNGRVPDWPEVTSLDLYRWDHAYGKRDDAPGQMGGSSEREEAKIRAYHVVERQHRKVRKAQVILDPLLGDLRMAPPAWSAERTAAYCEANGYALVERRVRAVRWTVTCGRVVLHDEWSPYADFTIVPCFAYFRRGSPFGMGRMLVSPQDQINKVFSQQLHVVNTTANSGWIVDSGALQNMELEDLEQRGAETGLVIEKQRDLEVAKIPPNPIPVGLDRVTQLMWSMQKEISGLGDAMRGTSRPEVSGVAIEASQARGNVALQVPLKNLRRARRRVAERVLELVQTFYSEPRIVMVANEDDPEKPKEPMAINARDAAGRIVNDITVGEYEVVLTDAPARDSFDEMQFAEALSLRGAGVAVPDDAIVEYSHLSHRERLAKRMRVESGVEPTPEQAEAAQEQADFQRRMMGLALLEKEAEIKKIAADIQVAAAEAGVKLSAPQMEALREINKANIAARGDDLRMKLAELSAETQREVSENAAAAKIAGTVASGTVQERVARIAARASERATSRNSGGD